MKRAGIGSTLVLAFLLIVPVSMIMSDVSNAQVAANSERDLWGSNIGDAILLKWLAESSAAEYIVYRSTSITGPWSERFRDENIDVGGMREDVTADAKVMDLCYRVEAVNGTGQVIRNYEPMCVPKFVQ